MGLFTGRFSACVCVGLRRGRCTRLFTTSCSFRSMLTKVCLGTGRPVSFKGHALVFVSRVRGRPGTIRALHCFCRGRPRVCIVTTKSLLRDLVKQRVSFPINHMRCVTLRPYAFMRFLHTVNRGRVTSDVRGVSLPTSLRSSTVR